MLDVAVSLGDPLSLAGPVSPGGAGSPGDAPAARMPGRASPMPLLDARTGYQLHPGNPGTRRAN